MRLTSYHNSLYTVIVNNSMDVHRPLPDFFAEQGHKNGWVGRSAIFGPRGVVLAEADAFETKRRAMLPIGQFRKAHRIPDTHLFLYKHVFDQYKERYDPNLWLNKVPETKKEAADYLKDKFRWTNHWQS
ncbi:MAG: hypothetical protein R3C40_08715 [Parvularculaceae bacterium]